jgi:predicted porin
MFKKIFAVTALMIAGTTALAEDRLSFGLRHDDFVGSDTTQHAVAINYDHKLNDKFSIGLGYRMIERNTNDKNNNRLTNRYMLRLNYNVNDYLYLNSAVGSKNQSLKASSEFWQVETGVKYRLNPDWQVRVGYAYREGFNGKEDDYFEGPRLRLQYRLNQRWNVSVTHDWYKFLNEDRNRIGVQFQKRMF